MRKPWYLFPFILVYKLVFFLVKVPIKIVKYFSIGLFFTFWYFINIVVSFLQLLFEYFTVICRLWFKLLQYLSKIFVYLSFFVYKFIKYLTFGVLFPIVLLWRQVSKLFVIIQRIKVKHEDKNAFKREAQERKRKIIEEEKLRKIEKERAIKLEKEKKEEEIAIAKAEAKNAKKKRIEKDVFINTKAILEKQSLTKKIMNILDFSKHWKNFTKAIKTKYEKLSFVRNARNKNDINRQALLLNFEGDDAKKSEVKIVYQYVAKSPEGKIVKGYLEAFSKIEVHSFLLSEGFEVYSIKTSQWIQFTHPNLSKSGGRIKNKDLIFMLTQLSTYIKAGIPLVDSLKILTRQYKNKTYQKIFRTVIYDLTMGDNFSEALNKQGNAFPRLLINMTKAAEMTGELPETLDDMADYFTESEKTRKQMISAMTYPAIILVISLVVIGFVLIYVIPKFVKLYENMDGAKIPAFTLLIMNMSNFLQKNILYIIIGILVFIIAFILLFKNIKSFKTVVQWLLMHIPVIGNVIIYNEVTMFTKTFASLLKHNVFITDSMEILNKITENEIYKTFILDTITNLARGEKISLAFKDQWAFPIPAYEMIVTGEKTGQLAEMMAKVSEYYQGLHANSVARIKTFIEPILIVLLTGGVGAIVMAIIIPMFGMYQNITG